MLHIAFISYDRYLSVSKPLKYTKKTTDKFSVTGIPTSVILVFIWFFSIAVWVPAILYVKSQNQETSSLILVNNSTIIQTNLFDTDFNSNKKKFDILYECNLIAPASIVLPHSLIVYFIPMFLIFLFYSKTIIIVNRKMKRRRSSALKFNSSTNNFSNTYEISNVDRLSNRSTSDIKEQLQKSTNCENTTTSDASKKTPKVTLLYKPFVNLKAKLVAGAEDSNDENYISTLNNTYKNSRKEASPLNKELNFNDNTDFDEIIVICPNGKVSNVTKNGTLKVDIEEPAKQPKSSFKDELKQQIETRKDNLKRLSIDSIKNSYSSHSTSSTIVQAGANIQKAKLNESIKPNEEMELTEKVKSSPTRFSLDNLNNSLLNSKHLNETFGKKRNIFYYLNLSNNYNSNSDWHLFGNKAHISDIDNDQRKLIKNKKNEPTTGAQVDISIKKVDEAESPSKTSPKLENGEAAKSPSALTSCLSNKSFINKRTASTKIVRLEAVDASKNLLNVNNAEGYAPMHSSKRKTAGSFRRDSFNTSPNPKLLLAASSSSNAASLNQRCSSFKRIANDAPSKSSVITSSMSSTIPLSTISFISKREKNITYKLGIIMVIFLISWLPFSFLWSLNSVCASCISETVYLISFWLAYLNSIFTPVILLYNNSKYRRSIFYLKSFLVNPFCCCCLNGNSVEGYNKSYYVTSSKFEPSISRFDRRTSQI